MNENFKKEKLYEFLNYNKKLNLELVKDSEDLTGELSLKLFYYSAIQFNHLNWEIRDQYLELLENYMEEKMDRSDFVNGMNLLEKYFSIEEFFQNYPSTLTNQQKTRMKEYFIELIELFEEYGLIESTYKVVSTKTVYETNKLTPQNISKGFVVYEKLSI